MTIQRAIDFSIIAEINKSGPDNKKTLLKKFAFPPYLDDAFVFILQTQFPFIIMLSFIVIAPSICSEVCYEKEKRLKVIGALMFSIMFTVCRIVIYYY